MMLLRPQQENDISLSASGPEPESDLIRHFKLLSERDQFMVRLACQLGLTHREVASVLHTSAGTITRRLHRILQLLRDPLIAALVKPQCNLEPAHREVALEHLLHRIPVDTISRRRHISRRQVLRMIEFARGWFGAQKKRRNRI